MSAYVDYVDPGISIRSWVSEGHRTSDFEESSPRPLEAVRSTRDDIEPLILKALDTDKVDWRTPKTISAETGLSELIVRSTLAGMGDVVRRPFGDRSSERDMYRLKSRGLTRGERFRIFREALTRG
jgi:hypothetical protein